MPSSSDISISFLFHPLVINVSQCSLAYGERVKAMESRFTADIMLALGLSDASLPINLSQVRVLKKEVYSIAPSSKISFYYQFQASSFAYNWVPQTSRLS
jgi:hypothetical protein